MRYYEGEEMPYMSLSRTGQREDEEPNAFLGMDDRHEERMCATRMLLYLWKRHPEAVVYLDGREFRPTDEEFAEAQEGAPSTVRVADEGMPEALVSASVEVDEVLHEEDEPRRASMRATIARARKTARPCKKGGSLRAKMKAVRV